MSKGSQSSPFAAGAVIAKKYRLIRLLGEGAMGVVWLAVNESTGGEVALKLIVRPEYELRVRLLREAQACSSIRHKNVVQVYDVGETDSGDPFLVMALLSGETLGDMLARRRRLSQQEAATIGRDVARALAAAHDKSIIHRDLKPANIFLHHEPGEDVPVVKVLDFGVSKNLLMCDGMRTVAGGAVGSPMYMSPEQARGDATIDGRSDIWSLGIVLFEMLTGLKPFIGETLDVVHKVLFAEVPRVSQKVRKVAPELDALVMACLARPREERPWPALEVARQLEAFATPGSRAPVPLPADSWDGGDAPAVPEARRSGPSAVVPLAPPILPRPSSDRMKRVSSPGFTGLEDTEVGHPGLDPSKSPGQGPTRLEPSRASVVGPTPPKPEPALYGNTPAKPGVRGVRPAGQSSSDSDEDAETRRFDPQVAVVMPNPPAPPSPHGPRDGTIPIYPSGPPAPVPGAPTAPAVPAVPVPRASAPRAPERPALQVTLPMSAPLPVPASNPAFTAKGTLRLNAGDVAPAVPWSNTTPSPLSSTIEPGIVGPSVNATVPPSALVGKRRITLAANRSARVKLGLAVATAALLAFALTALLTHWIGRANADSGSPDRTGAAVASDVLANVPDPSTTASSQSSAALTVGAETSASASTSSSGTPAAASGSPSAGTSTDRPPGAASSAGAPLTRATPAGTTVPPAEPSSTRTTSDVIRPKAKTCRCGPFISERCCEGSAPVRRQ